MRQVPHYLIIGNGRVSKHFQCYFSLLGLNFDLWDRTQAEESLKQALRRATHALVLISDKAINEFCEKYLTNASPLRIHFSGSLATPSAYGAHPLMTFPQQLYSLSDYQAIPFVLDENAPEFQTLLPGLVNPNYRLARESKAKYHALCVLSGNFSVLLWQKFFSSLADEFNLPPEVAKPYLLRVMNNLHQEPLGALTGPLVRGDQATLMRNLDALKNDPFQEVYSAFINSYQRSKT